MKTTIVVDCSALVEVVAGKSPERELLRRLMTSTASAPELIDAEAMSVLRRMERNLHLTPDDATFAMSRITASPVNRVPLRTLLRRAWELRHAVHTYDSLYLALAEELNVPLITCDAKLAGSNGHQVDIEVYPVS
ncbi:type II toxin-antitoxin system VapC family toxin [Saccharothrix coeruleofusca]|uniref:Ribonuclease VapC n=1 Tax=Saccharothrix coeruleofusca TaxID=33919 RepID=A0A918EG98_9PSEU|nr:type II toxin-antitoxin system VapC family toxin [Saccharothrix coeruleofusca]GGP67091.1 ribonuclease VapC12 [Saccharothrix coeruleofusca]